MTRCNCPGPCNAHGCLLKEIERLKAEVAERIIIATKEADRAQAAELQVESLRNALRRMEAEGKIVRCGRGTAEGCGPCELPVNHAGECGWYVR